MNGRKTGWDKIMKCLKESINRNVMGDCKDLHIGKGSYERLWHAQYNVLKIFSEPTYKKVRELVRISAIISKAIHNCEELERCGVSKKITLKCTISGNGLESVEMNSSNVEAEMPPSRSESSIREFLMAIFCLNMRIKYY
ncbi:MAG: hypothetical protein ACP5M9_02895 [Candidatus Micrarchaeia archaeon]